MTTIFPQCPPPGALTLDWAAVRAAYPWIQAMAACPQDPTHHGEGDVEVHTRLVTEALLADAAYQALDAEGRAILFAAALLHDVAKPATTVDDGGRITAPGHSAKGAILARQILYDLDVPFHLREQVCGLIRWHQHPFFLIERPDAARMAHRISQSARCDHLAILATADARGRICQDPDRLLDHVALFAEYCGEQACLDHPRAFASDHSRFEYFRRDGRDPDYCAYDDTRSTVTVLSGLPGMGKDRWLRTHRPSSAVISLDELRAALGFRATDNQGPVLAAARDQARVYLRAGTPFVWNATNPSRQRRDETIGLFADYHARIEIVYIEVPRAVHHVQNTERAAAVPAQVIARMRDKWEVPTLDEAHQVTYVVRDAR